MKIVKEEIFDPVGASVVIKFEDEAGKRKNLFFISLHFVQFLDHLHVP